MKVYELMKELASMPAGADVSACPSGGKGESIDADSVYQLDDEIVSIMLNGSYEEHMDGGEDS